MTWIATSLWDLILPSKNGGAVNSIVTRTRPTKIQNQKSRTGMQARYDALVEEMKSTYGIRVRKWRKSSSGVAWTIRYIKSGRIVKLIESPYPRGPMSCAIFMHEIGHHAIGLGVYRPRCLEEYHVWVWALRMMRAKGFNVTQAVEKRMDRSMRYAVAKARRRGMKEIPAELLPYV